MLGKSSRYRVNISVHAQAELDRLRAHDHRRILEAIRTQLLHDPLIATRNRKRLGEGVTADFDFVPPLWELRVDEFRVFYIVDEVELLVLVHAVREKPAHKTTQEVLNEDDHN